MDPDLKKTYMEQPQTATGGLLTPSNQPNTSATSSKFYKIYGFTNFSLPCCPKRDLGYKPYLKALLRKKKNEASPPPPLTLFAANIKKLGL